MIMNLYTIYYLLYSFLIFVGKEYTATFSLVRKNWREVSSSGILSQIGNVWFTLTYRGIIHLLLNPGLLLITLVIRFYFEQEKLARKAAKPVKVEELPPFLREKLRKAEEDSKTSALRAEGISVSDMMRRKRLNSMSQEKKDILRFRGLITFLWCEIYTVEMIRQILSWIF